MNVFPNSAVDVQWVCHEDTTLRINALRRLVVAGVATGFVWYGYVAAVLEVPSFGPWGGPAVLVICSLLAYWIVGRWGFMPAACMCVAGVALSVSLSAWTYAEPSLLLFLALPVGIAGLLIGPAAGFAAALVVTAAVAAASVSSHRFGIPVSVVWHTAALALCIAFLTWLAMYPLQMTLTWAWASYERARQQTEQMMEQRGRLNRTIKDLDAAYRRLEGMAGELERARKAADEARRLKAEFAANISHELRTPLNLIIGFGEMMAMAPHTYDEPLPVAYRGDVQAVYRNAQHLSNLIDDVLDLSQIEAGRMGLAKEPTSLAEVIDEALAAVAHVFEAKGLSLAVDIPEGLPRINVDRTRVRQVLINLLNNAARFTDQGGVTIAVRAESREVTVAVADTGVGIAQEDIPKVFEPFRQIDGSTRRRYGGSGLGLTISKRFVELHHGRMWVTSKVGEGTTFYFALPWREELGVAQLSGEWETWARVAPAKGSPKTVIVVDTEPATARLFQRYLDGYRAIPAANADEAQRLAAQEPIHALVVTASSGEAGWHERRQAREGLPTLPAIVCTLSGVAEASQLAGVATYLVKPISRERFLEAVAALGDHVHSLLIVDDDPEVVRLLSRMLRLAPRPYRIMRAYGGAQALAYLQRRRPEAVVLDLLMPEVDGYTVLEHMRADERLREIPAIVVSAKGQTHEALTAGLVGITRRDGFSVGELMRCVKANLDALHPPALRYTGPAPPAVSAE